MNKIIVSILVLLLLLSGGLGFYSYTLNQQIDSLSGQLASFQQEQADRIGTISDELTNIKKETLTKISGLEGKLKDEMSLTQTKISETEDKVRVLASNIDDAIARVDTIESEVRDTTTELSRSVINANKIYQKVSQATVRISDGQRTIGSGFVLDNEAHVVTAYHVIEELSSIYIIFPDGRTSKATVKGSCQYSDVAVLTLADKPDIELPPLANSSEIRVGEPVVTIGNPFDLTETLTAGIVSQVNRYDEVQSDTQSRWVANLIQFDAPANPGNSGCPLLNSRGEVIGLVIARIDPSQGDGIYYAVSSNKVRRVATSIIEKGSFDYPWLGVSIANLTPQIVQNRNLTTMNGVLVAGFVSDSSPAAIAGMKTDDIILAIDDVEIRDIAEFTSYLGEFKSPGELVTLKGRRGTTELQLVVEIGKHP